MTDPKGIRNNNPTNIRLTSNIWSGQIWPSPDSSFVCFDTPQNGIRAAALIIRHYYMAYGLATVRGIIGRWAPSIENDTNSYCSDVAQRMNVGLDDILDVMNPHIMNELVAAIIWHENGEMPYSDDILSEGISGAIL